MKAEQLQEIRERHRDERGGIVKAHADRAALLRLADRLLSRGWETQDSYEEPICFFCGAPITYTSPSWAEMRAGAKGKKICNHDADCPADLCPPEVAK